MEFLGCAWVVIMIAAVIFAAVGNSKKQEQIDDLNKSLENTMSLLRSAREKTLEEHKPEEPTVENLDEIDMSLVSEPVHTIAQLIVEGETFSLQTGTYEYLYGDCRYGWVSLQHMKDFSQSSGIEFRNESYSVRLFCLDGLNYVSAFDWMEEEELKYLFKIANENHARLAEKERLEYKTMKRQEAIEFYTKSTSEDIQEGA